MIKLNKIFRELPPITSEETPKLDCDTSLSKWLKNIEDPDLGFSKQYDEIGQPLDSNNPKIEMHFPFLKRNFEFNMTEVFIKSQTGDILFQGKVISYNLHKDLLYFTPIFFH